MFALGLLQFSDVLKYQQYGVVTFADPVDRYQRTLEHAFFAADKHLSRTVMRAAFGLQGGECIRHRLDIGRAEYAGQRVAHQVIGCGTEACGEARVGQQHLVFRIHQNHQRLGIVGDGVQQFGLPLQRPGFVAQSIGIVHGAHAAAVTPGGDHCCSDEKHLIIAGDGWIRPAPVWRRPAAPAARVRCRVDG